MREMYYKAAEFLDLRKNHITSPVISPSWLTLGTSWNSWSIGYSVPNGWHTKVSSMPMAPVIPFARWTMTFKVHHQRSVHLAMHFSLDQFTVGVFILLWKGSDLVTAWFQSCFRPGILEKTLSNVSTYLPTCFPKEVCLMSPFWLRPQKKVWLDGSPGRMILPFFVSISSHCLPGASKFFMLALLSFWRFFV